METDRHYVERCLDGHPDDFRHLVRRYQPVLLAHLAGKLGRRDRAASLRAFGLAFLARR